MIEKRNAIDDGAVKDAAGDAGILDDIVDAAAGRMARARSGAAASASVGNMPFVRRSVRPVPDKPDAPSEA